MRICFLADGQSVHTQKWTRYFSERGHEVHLISFQRPIADEAVVHVLKRKVLTEDLDYFLQIPSVRHLVNEIKPDILHAHYLTSFGFLGACSGWHPLIVSALGTDILITPYRSLPYRMLTRFVLKRADLAIADAQISASKIIDLGTDEKRVVVIPSGIDPRLFYPNSGQKDPSILVSVRRHKPVYNLPMILKAVELLKNQGRAVKLLMAGDGPLRPELEELAKKSGIADSVEFLGDVPHEELGDVYRRSSVYVSIPHSDATSISLLEAMACGVFPIASDLPANREWIANGENGFLVPSDNIAVLGQRIAQALDNSNLRLKAARINQEIIGEKALWENNMKRVEELYLQLLRK